MAGNNLRIVEIGIHEKAVGALGALQRVRTLIAVLWARIADLRCRVRHGVLVARLDAAGCRGNQVLTRWAGQAGITGNISA